MVIIVISVIDFVIRIYYNAGQYIRKEYGHVYDSV